MEHKFHKRHNFVSEIAFKSNFSNKRSKSFVYTKWWRYWIICVPDRSQRHLSTLVISVLRILSSGNVKHSFRLPVAHCFRVEKFFFLFNHLFDHLFDNLFARQFFVDMDKLKRVLSGNDETAEDENRGIMGDVGDFFITVYRISR